MNKIWVGIILSLVWWSCKESLPPIDFGQAGVQELKDTTYVTSDADLPEAQYRGVLIEDLTGVKCVACPNAAIAAKNIKDSEKDNHVVILGMYPQGPLSFTLPYDGYVDMRTETAQLVATNIFDFGNSLPAGGINRTQFDGEPSVRIPYATWTNRANTFDGQKSIVNVDLSANEFTDSSYAVHGKFTFTDATTAQPYVIIYILEDGINHPQAYIDKVDTDYIHKHVVRAAVTPYNGSPMLSGSASKGTTVERSWEIVLPEGIDINKASVVALVNYNEVDNKEVIQCQEIKLK